eukprot:6984082-Ditylum_brightwellii.AAC.1
MLGYCTTELTRDIKTLNLRVAWVQKVDLTTNNKANDFVTYYDDVRLSGHGEDNCLLVMYHVGSMLNHIGQQDAAQKTRPPTTEESGALAGRTLK